MNENFKVFVIDDDPVVTDIITAILEAEYPVEAFDSVESCKPRLETEKPGMFLLDVSLPGMDGYSFCRELKASSDLAHIPVTFVSSNDTLEARLTGYDAGGEDFIVKPFEAEEVLRKVKVAQQLAEDRRNLKEQAEAAEYLSSLALASMDEAGIVLQFMSKLIGWNTEEEIAAGLIELMQRYRLHGVVQVRVSGVDLTLSGAGKNQPAEVGVMNHVRTMDRIFEFGNRSVHNFERVTIMVNDMPLNDPEYCGRLRDNLSVAAQGADSRLHAIETEQANRRSQAGIVEALGTVREALDALRQAHNQDRIASNDLILELEESLAHAFVTLGLTNNQERYMEDLVGSFMKRLMALLDRGEESFEALEALNQRLGHLLK